MTPALARINDKIKRFLGGDAFMLTVAAVVLIFWATQQLIAGLVILVLLASVAFIFQYRGNNTSYIICAVRCIYRRDAFQCGLSLFDSHTYGGCYNISSCPL